MVFLHDINAKCCSEIFAALYLFLTRYSKKWQFTPPNHIYIIFDSRCDGCFFFLSMELMKRTITFLALNGNCSLIRAFSTTLLERATRKEYIAFERYSNGERCARLGINHPSRSQSIDFRSHHRRNASRTYVCPMCHSHVPRAPFCGNTRRNHCVRTTREFRCFLHIHSEHDN